MNENNDITVTTLTEDEKQWLAYGDALKFVKMAYTSALKIKQANDEGKSEGINPKDEMRELSQTFITWAKTAIPEDETLVDMSMADLLASYWDQAEQRAATVTTGHEWLDNALSGGLEPGRLLAVLGTPNAGKTTFVHALAEHVACEGRPVIYVTSEDTPSTLLAKTLTRIGEGIDYKDVLKGGNGDKGDKEGKLKRDQIESARFQAGKRVSAHHMRYLDATTKRIPLDVIESKARAHFGKYGSDKPGVLVIDYLQRYGRALKGKNGVPNDIREAVTHVTEWARDTAVELNCTVIVISSIGRDAYKGGGNRTPMSAQGLMSAAKESGDIEYTCDSILALLYDEVQNSGMDVYEIELHMVKNRQGKRNIAAKFAFDPMKQIFGEIV